MPGVFRKQPGCGMDLVRACGLRKSYERRNGVFHPGVTVQALDGVDLEIRTSATLALVGESGSGKSTLARCLARLERPDAGEVWFEDRRIDNLKGKLLTRLRRDIQLVFQDPASALNPWFSAREIVEEPMAVQGMGNREGRRRKAHELMESVGLSTASSDKLPLEFSGGQRQRLAIARALALEPKLLILDEALSGLDLSVQAQLVNLLMDLQAERALTYLFVSHDLGLAGQIADEVAVMYKGKIVDKAARGELFSVARHPHTRALLAAVPSISGDRVSGVADPRNVP